MNRAVIHYARNRSDFEKLMLGLLRELRPSELVVVYTPIENGVGGMFPAWTVFTCAEND